MPDIFSLVPITVPYDAIRAIFPGGNDPLVQTLQMAPRWNQPGPAGTAVALTYHISDAPPTYSQSARGYTAENALPWALAQASTIEGVLAVYSTVANITFTKVDSQADANISFFLASTLEVGGFAYFPGDTRVKGTYPGDIFLNHEFFSVNGSNSYLAFHEIGHALGLAHLYDAEGKPTIETFGLPGSRLLSLVDDRPLMKPYFILETANSSSGYSMSTLYDPWSPMLIDVEALQLMYGANMATGAGDDRYSFVVNPNFYRTIWDAGGHDVIDVSNQTNSCYISLVSGTYSTIGLRDPFDGYPAFVRPGALTLQPDINKWNDGTNSLVIAFNSVIEDVIGSSADDVLIGNDVANRITGGRGDDRLDGGDGIDIALYDGARASHYIARKQNSWEVIAPEEGTDTLTAIERIEFSDMRLALALDIDGNAGTVAKLLGAVFGAHSVSNKEYAGIGLSLLDGGMSYEALAAVAVAATGKSDYADIVDLLWTNVMKTDIPPDALTVYKGWLENGMSVGELTKLAADSPDNLVNIDLVGLALTGLEYSYI